MNRLPEVEPLGDARWARIEQSLMQRLEGLPESEPARAPGWAERAPLRSKASARMWPVALVATFAVSAAAAIALQVTRPSVHAATSRVVTEASPSHVTIADNSLDVSPESGIVVTEEEHATVLTLERGEVSLHVAPREKNRPFLVEAGDVHVRVVGTEFTVRRVGVGATVSVRHGVVEVRENGELAVVRGGEHWPDTAKDTAAIAAAPAPAVAPPAAGTLLAAPSSPLVAARSPRPLGQPPRKQGGGNVNAEPIESTSSPALPAGRGPGSSLVDPAPSAAPSVMAVTAPTSGALPLEPSPQSQYEAAAQLERSDPARALHIYTDLAGGSDAWAQNALYAAGRLQADRGARGDAARLLEEYLRRFPRGSNAQDARALRDSLR